MVGRSTSTLSATSSGAPSRARWLSRFALFLARVPSAADEKAARNKRCYLAAKAAFNRGDLDGCMAFYAEDHQIRSQEVGRGRDHIRGFLVGMLKTWSDLQIDVEHAVAEGDWVMGHCRSTAVHARPVMGIEPTHRRVETMFWDLHRFNEEGLIAETWNVSDGLAIMRQLTAPDALAPGAA